MPSNPLHRRRPVSGSREAMKVKGALLQQGRTPKELAAEWGISLAAVYRAMNGHPHSIARQSVTEIIGFWPWPDPEGFVIYSRGE